MFAVRGREHSPREDGEQNQTFAFSERNIAWGGLAKQYAASPGYSSPSDALPPPNWAEAYPDGYTEESGFPNLAENEHFQVWMRVAAFPTFRKLWGRNDNDVMTAGTYRILINMSECTMTSYTAHLHLC